MSNSLTELLAKKAELERQIIEVQREERQSAITQIRTLMAQHGLTLADIGQKSFSPAPAKTRVGAKVAAKYRDPATGQTWSGRGLRPNWLKAALAGGAQISDFTV